MGWGEKGEILKGSYNVLSYINHIMFKYRNRYSFQVYTYMHKIIVSINYCFDNDDDMGAVV